MSNLPGRAAQTERNLHLSILIGSGFSVPDGLPTVSHINKRLANLKEADFFLYQDQTAGFYKEGDEYRDPNAKITYPDRLFAQEFVAFYNHQVLSGKPENFDYEVFFDYFMDNLNEKAHKDEIDDFVIRFKKAARWGERKFEESYQLLNRFLNIFNQLVAGELFRSRYYQNVSFLGLYHNYESFMRFLQSVLKDHVVYVHSLNHDMLFDYFGKNISGLWDFFTDGFSEKGSPYFGSVSHTYQIRNDEPLIKNYKVRLAYYTGEYDNHLHFYKLHGSIDTYPLYIANSSEVVVIKREYGVSDFYKEKFDEKTKKYEYENPFAMNYPSFLTGKTTKIKNYKQGFYAGLLARFANNLSLSERLIIIGYGFQDEGINNYLENHFLLKGKNVLVIDIARPKSSLLEKYSDQITYSQDGITGTGLGVYDRFMKLK